MPNNQYSYDPNLPMSTEPLPGGGEKVSYFNGAPQAVPYYHAPFPRNGTEFLRVAEKSSPIGPGTSNYNYILKSDFDYFTLQAVQPKIDELWSVTRDSLAVLAFGFLLLTMYVSWVSSRTKSLTKIADDHSDELYAEDGKLTELDARIEALEKQKAELRARVQELENIENRRSQPPTVA